MIIVRNAKLEDLPIIDTLNRNSFTGTISHNLIVLRQFLDCFNSLFKVAIVDNKIVGYVVGAIIVNSDVGFGLTLSTDPNYLRKGIAKALAKELFHEYKKMGLNKVRLTVNPINIEALTLYQHIGFIIIKNYDNYYENDDQRYLMELSLSNYLKS